MSDEKEDRYKFRKHMYKPGNNSLDENSNKINENNNQYGESNFSKSNFNDEPNQFNKTNVSSKFNFGDEIPNEYEFFNMDGEDFTDDFLNNLSNKNIDKDFEKNNDKFLRDEEILENNIIFNNDSINKNNSLLDDDSINEYNSFLEDEEKPQIIDLDVIDKADEEELMKDDKDSYYEDGDLDFKSIDYDEPSDEDFSKYLKEDQLDESEENLKTKTPEVESKITAKDIDLRIIVDNTKNAEYLNKATENIPLNQYNIKISAIIQTFDVEIAKSTTEGADIIFISNDSGEEGKILYNQFYNYLKSENNYIEFLKIPQLKSDDEIIAELGVNIHNLIINVGLSSIFNITNFNHFKNQIKKLEKDYDEVLSENATLIQEKYDIEEEISQLKKDNNDYDLEIKELQKVNDQLKSEFADFKSRYSNIHTKNILEIFSLKKLWMDVFDEELLDETKIVIATNQFKPDDIIIGQGLIGARNMDQAIDWLKVVRTALIFVENNKEDLQEEIYNNSSNEKPSNYRNEYDNDDSENDEDEDYNIPENFSNFMF